MPQDHGISSALPEVNHTVGETLDDNGHGRIAAWQVFY